MRTVAISAACLLGSASGLQLSAGVAQPRSAVVSRAGAPLAQFGFLNNDDAEEEKKGGFNPLGVGPRGRDTDSTSYQIKAFEEGTDYVFFQSPSPKYGRQADLPDFFSGENLGEIFGAEGIVTPLRAAIGAVGIAAFLAVSAVLFTAPGSATPFAFLDNFVPAAKEYRAGEAKKRTDFEDKKAADAAAAKAAEAAAAKAAEAAAAKATAAAK